MGKAALPLAFVVCFGCGGSESASVTAPLVVTAPPPVTYPSLVGSWGGTLAIDAGVYDGYSETIVCTHGWIITTQTEGTFTGTFQTSGGTVYNSAGTPFDCSGAGTISGVVSSSGSINNLTPNIPLSPGDCVRVEGSGLYSGNLAGFSPTLMTQTWDVVRCPELLPGGYTGFSRKLLITLTPRT